MQVASPWSSPPENEAPRWTLTAGGSSGERRRADMEAFSSNTEGQPSMDVSKLCNDVWRCDVAGGGCSVL